MYVRIILRGMLKLIRVDTLRRVHTVGFLAGRLIHLSSRDISLSNLDRNWSFQNVVGTNKNAYYERFPQYVQLCIKINFIFSLLLKIYIMYSQF